MATPKPLRADARRNRVRILEAAVEVFTAKGPTVPIEEVARRADVAVGTVFGHFPTKEALLEAVFLDRLRTLTDKAHSLRDAPDPTSAFVEFFTYAVQETTMKLAFLDAQATTGTRVGTDAGAAVDRAVTQAAPTLHAAIEALLDRAQRAGTLRSDLHVPELIPLLVGASRAMDTAGRDQAVRQRVMAIILDGLCSARGKD
ncbi:TetR/AcrR family transcriptional regulator [Streptomyces platensis]|uniref:TetR/AcrR family transcriptional regulator n=1 Tax=Streptomyces platensis TaxID=58346 RepID=UPI0036AE9F6B